MSLRTGILATMAVLGLAMLGVWWFTPSVLVGAQRLMDRETLEALVARAGIWGPLLIIGLMTVAVVASPVPSAPIALAAGAAYGHLWGTLQVVLGAELGALIAFGLAHALGRDALRRLFGDRVDAGLLGSQNADLDGLCQPPDALRVLRHDQLCGGTQLPASLAFRFSYTG